MLDDLNVLIVEDEVLIALDVSDTFSEMGADVRGPYGSLEDARSNTDGVDVAVLDVDVRGETIFPLADELAAQGVALLFHTGRIDTQELSDRYGPGAQVLSKPCQPKHLAKAVSGLVGRTD